MSVHVTLSLKCNRAGCSTKQLKVEGSKATRHDLYVLAMKQGWHWKNANTHFCPMHDPTRKTAKVSKKPAKKALPKLPQIPSLNNSDSLADEPFG